MIPRTVKRPRAAPPPPPPIASTSFLPRTIRNNNLNSVASTSSIPIAPNSANKKRKVELVRSKEELDRLSLIYSTLIHCLSCYSLSVHQSSGLLEKFEESKDGYVSLQVMLNLPPIAAITKVQIDLQNSIKLFQEESRNVTLDESGYRIGYKVPPEFESLKRMTLMDWDDYIIYLENIPTLSSHHLTLLKLTSNLSSLLQIKIQSILLPALFVPPDIRPTHINDSSSQSQQYQQDLAIAASNSKNFESEFNLPKGGGPFKGFGFIILEDVADREKVLKDWSWKKEELNLKKEELIDPVSTKPSALIDVEEEEESEVSIEKMMDLADESILEETISIALVETLTEATDSIFGDLLESKLISELNKEEMESERLRKVDMEKAKKSGMKALSFKQWREFKLEYLNYQTALKLKIASIYPKRRQRSTSPFPPPPSVSLPTPTPAPIRERQLPPHQTLSHLRRNSSKKPICFRGYDVNCGEEKEEEVVEGFPHDCIVWLRGLNQKSTKSSIKTLLIKILKESREFIDKTETVGQGIEFVDFEKGLDTAIIRTTDSSISNNLSKYFTATPQYHIQPTEISTEPSGETVVVRVEILKGAREGIYWEKLKKGNRNIGGIAFIAQGNWVNNS